jgi:hypothetical protein
MSRWNITLSSALVPPTFTDWEVTRTANSSAHPFHKVVFNTDGVALVTSRDDKETYLSLVVRNSSGYGYGPIETFLMGRWKNKKAKQALNLYLDIGKRLVDLRSHGWDLGFDLYDHLHIYHPVTRKARRKINTKCVFIWSLRLRIRRLDSLLASPIVLENDEGWEQYALERGGAAKNHLVLRQALVDHDDLSVEQLLELVERSITAPLDSPCLTGSLEFHRKAMQAKHSPQAAITVQSEGQQQGQPLFEQK